MKISLDQERCVSGGQCVFAAPDVFDQRESDGVAIFLVDPDDVSEDFREDVMEAIDICPAQAIALIE
ncbi:MAG: ferredoxin [Bowdeniella nasicola]|nr:ferredoxin [Bowdeniella nasicola]